MEPKAPPVEKALGNLMAPEESHQIRRICVLDDRGCVGWNRDCDCRGVSFSALLRSCQGAAIEGRLLGDAFGEPTSA